MKAVPVGAAGRSEAAIFLLTLESQAKDQKIARRLPEPSPAPTGSGSAVCQAQEDIGQLLGTGPVMLGKARQFRTVQIEHANQAPRPEERRVGKACVSTCTTRGTAQHQ